MKDNPYDPPKTDADMRRPFTDEDFSLSGAAKFVTMMAIGGAAIGLALGSLLGTIAPDYYRTVFSRNGTLPVNPVAMGAGLGLSQGAGFGVVAGLVLVVTYCWYKTRKLNAKA